MDIRIVIGSQTIELIFSEKQVPRGRDKIERSHRSLTGSLAGIADALKRYNRPQELGKLEISVTPPPGTSAVFCRDERGIARLCTYLY